MDTPFCLIGPLNPVKTNPNATYNEILIIVCLAHCSNSLWRVCFLSQRDPCAQSEILKKWFTKSGVDMTDFFLKYRSIDLKPTEHFNADSRIILSEKLCSHIPVAFPEECKLLYLEVKEGLSFY